MEDLHSLSAKYYFACTNYIMNNISFKIKCTNYIYKIQPYEIGQNKATDVIKCGKNEWISRSRFKTPGS